MMKKIVIFDTTLRDGEQSPGCSMNLNEKLKMARQLERLKVDVIEAGFPIASEGDFEAVNEIAKTISGCTICGLARATKKDIDAAAQALKPAKRSRIHVFLATSDIHLEYKLKMSRQQALDQIKEMVSYAYGKADEVEFSAEDGSRTELAYLAKVYETAIEAGASIVNIPDTVGYVTPNEMYQIVDYVKKNVHNIDRAQISVHCHNDLGMAVSNSLAAIKAGADQVECTVSGIGERAGNSAMEEVVMSLYTRKDYFDATTNIDTTQIYRTCSKLSRIIGTGIAPNKAIVGANAFAHESGIHQHGVMQNKATYEIMTPESIGIVANKMVLGKHSGKHAFEERLVELGYSLKPEEIVDLFAKFKELCDRKKEVGDLDIEALVEAKSQTFQYYKLDRFVINSGNSITSTAIVRLSCNGEIKEDVCYGDGPINAAYKAIQKIAGMDAQLADYKIKSVSQGEDALGEVTVKVKYEGQVVTGRGLSTDIIESSILAFLHAMNKIMSKAKKS